uniref:Uncharacterized protein n=1 Tax=Parascaris univalens TaxID=6257 RepID=A0A915AHA9_PARUN
MSSFQLKIGNQQISESLAMKIKDINITGPTTLYRSVAKMQRKGACPMSPYATYLTNSQQDVLFELITKARKVGADEQSIKQHIDGYLKQILSPQKLKEFHEANERFERERHKERTDEGTGVRTPRNARSLINVQGQKMTPQKFVVEGEQDLNQIFRFRSRLLL